ncbi:uncharacterized protein LOC109860235 isoform X1 [Pseudomyrmex gracilis]|uniref:uncharacterized protein LOC109860235 isoform X1 n=1 Tax=Pseudomyrmex gracilis TaxID=219809 RepID=UPI00099592C3|nr:uncharacterized protein LOC109860235 isoform X1 [Pseudomyrmex gracilis]XP_020294773.1 uncharacterized protein LOC109860235 isoform X1 [Pseudomyrmex gracilis]XP_020294774.1 uncharacterized protein LOC109860235 isoform X1 [Pseudomyrmex gracilis]XP_020294775.1 uncharacterized protein LOC109860235 isoform X1 [Pseudomyrmex gracilis]
MMANDMLIRTLFVLSVIPLTLSTREQFLCFKNSTLLETAGDAILTVFVDANYGQYCNISSAEGFQQVLTALHVVRTLNKYDYVPDVKLDLIPSGSYVIKPETPDFDFEKFTNVDEFMKNSEDSAYHSPYLLSIGKAIVGLVEVSSSVRERNCSIDNCDDDQNCAATQFRSESTREIRESDVYETLRVQPKSHSIKYVVAMKTQHELVDVALYGIEMSELRVFSDKMISRMPGLCLENLVGNCENCTNFQKRADERDVTEGDIISKSVLKSSLYVPVFLIAIVCGTIVCCIILIFIIYRFVTDDILDGNPTLTIILVLMNMFTLLTALPFCMTDDYFDAESINAQKILLTTLAFGFTFSIVLSRTLFMALSTSGVLIAHINGYLLSLMVFFMSGVQIAISIMFFILNTVNSAVIVRSSTFIALLGYDMFLLIALFIASFFTTKIQRNYNEGKCFLGTAGGLLVLWTTWLICFVSMQPENRDVIVSFGIIGTAYLIIFGIFIPRIYYMITLLPARKDLESNIGHSPANSIVNTIVRQSRTSHVCPTRENQILQMSPMYPNYYGSPNLRSKHIVRCRNSNHHEMSDYGFQAEMKEINADYDIPQISIEEAESSRNVKIAPNDVVYAQPRIYTSQRIVLVENKNTENIRSRDNSSPTSISHRMYPMRYASPANVVREQRIDEENEDEEEEDDEDREDQEIKNVVRVTRF